MGGNIASFILNFGTGMGQQKRSLKAYLERIHRRIFVTYTFQ